MDKDSSSSRAEAPPEYDTLTKSSLRPWKFKIQPREDEGRETLPSYSCAISLENVFTRKLEFQGAIHRAHNRHWRRVFVKLQGTALAFYECKRANPFRRSRERAGKDIDVPAGMQRGRFLRDYNLQHADVGIAADYVKFGSPFSFLWDVLMGDHRKKYVIRVRAETDQFLLSCYRLETFFQWLESLFVAINLALPIDDREIPRDPSIPRPRRRRRCTSEGLLRRESPALVREQLRVVGEQDPYWADRSILEESDSAFGSSNAISIRTASMISTDNPSNPSLSPETGKWRPEHEWSAMKDMMYAKRCMATLLLRSPRKSNLVIVEGKQWIANWETGVLMRCQPPEYEDIGRERDVVFRLGFHGDAVRA
jgi:hypothetical protein